jgi:hypothetical protein
MASDIQKAMKLGFKDYILSLLMCPNSKLQLTRCGNKNIAHSKIWGL